MFRPRLIGSSSSAPIYSHIIRTMKSSCNYLLEVSSLEVYLSALSDNACHVALCMMRIYALYNKSRWVLCFLIGISVISVAVAVVNEFLRRSAPRTDRASSGRLSRLPGAAHISSHRNRCLLVAISSCQMTSMKWLPLTPVVC